MLKTKNTFGISERSFLLLMGALKEYNEIEKAVIFGSRAMKNEKTGSDIDIAIYGNKIKPELIRELKVLFNEKYNIPYFVDIVLYNEITNCELKEHINKEGKILINKRNKIKNKQTM